jgi:curved DNA-binding protein CbpA
MTFEDLQKAREVFNLSEHATSREIKSRHRELVKLYHPDIGGEHAPERIKLVNAAYKILLSYTENYRFSFSEEEFYEQNPEERLRRQFESDPLWGTGSES